MEPQKEPMNDSKGGVEDEGLEGLSARGGVEDLDFGLNF